MKVFLEGSEGSHPKTETSNVNFGAAVFQAHLSHPHVLQLFGYFWDRGSSAGSGGGPIFSSFLETKGFRV